MYCDKYNLIIRKKICSICICVQLIGDPTRITTGHITELLENSDGNYQSNMNVDDISATEHNDDVINVNGVNISVGSIDQLLSSLPRDGGLFADLGMTLTLVFERGDIKTRLVCFYQRNETSANSNAIKFTNADLAEVVRTHFSTFPNITFIEVISSFSLSAPINSSCLLITSLSLSYHLLIKWNDKITLESLNWISR